MGILEDIVADRRERIASKGHAQGLAIPERRLHPLIPFCAADGLIMEMKRASPSKGDIASFDPAAKARDYRDLGARNVSVLTEEGRFRGSLSDLMAAKEACPELAFLRKDFLLDPEDVDLSYRAGADAILLIAAILHVDLLRNLHGRARDLGMAVLVEVHDIHDIAKAREIGAPLLGINARDLSSFRIDPLLPLALKPLIDWEAKVIYESGIRHPAEASLPAMAGFQGILVGEAVSRSAESGKAISEAFRKAPRRRFWSSVATARQPLAKVCGLACREDVAAAEEAGADILGFVLAPSPRQVKPEFIRSLGKAGRALRVGVVTDAPDALDPQVRALVEEGFLDAIQFHDDSAPEEFRKAIADSGFAALGIPFYKALRQRGETIPLASDYACPRILVDAFSAEASGGTGKRLDESILEALGPGAWIAGGLKPGIALDIAQRFKPGLMDASSGLESSPGRKDHALLASFITEVKGE